MDSASAISSFLAATLLGFLVGLERERKREVRGSIFAGIRTFPLIALLGAISGQLSGEVGTMVIPLGFAVLGALLSLSYWRTSAGEKVGGTSEIAALVTFGLGVLAGLGHFTVALAGAVITTGVLSLRDELRQLSRALSPEDLFATVQFAAVSLVILPLVPDRPLGPWGVWNPHTIWLQVVLISGLSFVGYLAAKIVGTARSIGLGGLLGGLVSSTAVTLSYSRRSRTHPALTLLLAVGVLLASAVMAPRILVLLGIVAPDLVVPALPSLATLFALTLVGCGLFYRLSRKQPVEELELANPFELRTALQFAVVFALILLVARAAEVFLGESGVYFASILAGLTRPDAMALTLGQQVQAGLDPAVAARGLTLAVVSNTLFKAGLALSLGSRRFGRVVLGTLLLAALAAVAMAWAVVPYLLNSSWWLPYG
jgi:uncharacterized membrane protein (DUF4010 family)